MNLKLNIFSSSAEIFKSLAKRDTFNCIFIQSESIFQITREMKPRREIKLYRSFM